MRQKSRRDRIDAVGRFIEDDEGRWRVRRRAQLCFIPRKACCQPSRKGSMPAASSNAETAPRSAETRRTHRHEMNVFRDGQPESETLRHVAEAGFGRFRLAAISAPATVADPPSERERRQHSALSSSSCSIRAHQLKISPADLECETVHGHDRSVSSSPMRQRRSAYVIVSAARRDTPAGMLV